MLATTRKFRILLEVSQHFYASMLGPCRIELYIKVVKHLDTWYDKGTLSMEESSRSHMSSMISRIYEPRTL
jgi:hypothetical protein